MKLAIFDLDGTLVESVCVDTECFVRAFEDEFGIRGVDQAWDRYEHATDTWITRAILRRHLGREPEAEDVDRIRSAFLSRLRRARDSDPGRFSPIAGAPALLRRLAAETHWRAARAWAFRPPRPPRRCFRRFLRPRTDRMLDVFQYASAPIGTASLNSTKTAASV